MVRANVNAPGLAGNEYVMRRSVKIISTIGLIFILSGCGQVEKWYYCGYGQQSVKNQDYTGAVRLLGTCLELQTLLPEQRASYLQSRALAHFSLDHFAAALRDQEASFRLVAPSTQRELVNHAVYLRLSGKPLASLDPLREAEMIDEREGRASMMTQYNLGWSLYELGRYDEAIAAYSKGITSRPYYAFAYFRRGLAYDKVGRVAQAEDDFDMFVSILHGEDIEFKEGFVDELRKTSLRYPDLEALLPESNR